MTENKMWRSRRNDTITEFKKKESSNRKISRSSQSNSIRKRTANQKPDQDVQNYLLLECHAFHNSDSQTHITQKQTVKKTATTRMPSIVKLTSNQNKIEAKHGLEPQKVPESTN